MVSNNMVFDLGFHLGEDTEFYLSKGFNVVAVEANPLLANKGSEKFKKYIKSGKLILLNKAVTNPDKTKSNFYIHPNKSDWSSCFRELAESDGTKAKTVCVEATNLYQLVATYGIPRYVKTDIEGFDIEVARQLLLLDKKPLYVSFETNKKDYAAIFSYLFVAGYKHFQLVNQANHPYRAVLNKNGEGSKNTDYKFDCYSSGYFGKDLPADKWLSYGEALERYIKYKELKQLDNKELALGWIDLHAKL